jgi:nucleotide-binding universal stress UspA family protein
MNEPVLSSPRVLLATDDSEAARTAETWVARLRWAETPVVDVVTVASRAIARLGWSMGAERQALSQAVERMRQGELEAAERVANEVGERLQLAGLMVHTWARQGETRDVLLDMLAAERFDVVAIGPRGRSRVAAMLLGSVTQDIVEYATCSVLVARSPLGQDGPLPTHVLVPVDGSTGAQGVVSWLDGAGWLSGARVTLLGLLGERAGLEWDEPDMMDEVSRLVREDAAATLEAIAEPLVDRDILVDVDLVEGHPLQAVIDSAESRGADLVGIGRLPRRPGADAFSEKVARYVPTSVIMVPVGVSFGPVAS